MLSRRQSSLANSGTSGRGHEGPSFEASKISVHASIGSGGYKNK